MKRVWSNLTAKERDEDGIYQKGYADGRKCMERHVEKLQKKIEQLERDACLEKKGVSKNHENI